MMPQCSSLLKVELVMLFLSTLAVMGAGMQTQHHHRGDGDDDDDDEESHHSHHGGPQAEQKLDQAGLEDSLKSGGAEGLASMLAAMGAMHHETNLIPITKDADGNAMYNFGAFMTPAPEETTQAVTMPPTTTNFGASLLKTVAKVSPTPTQAVAATSMPAQAVAATTISAQVVPSTPSLPATKGALFQGLRGSVAPAAAAVEASSQFSAPLPVSTSSNQEQSGPQIESMRQGLTAIRDRITSLMGESDDMLFGSQSNVHAQPVALSAESAGMQKQFAEMLKRVSALEEEHGVLEKQVHNQSDHIQGLEKEENAEKEQLATALKNNTALRASAQEVKDRLLHLEQQSKELQADEAQAKKQLGSMEQQNKQLQTVVEANHAVTRQKGSSKVSAAHKSKHQKSSRRKSKHQKKSSLLQHKAKHVKRHA